MLPPRKVRVLRIQSRICIGGPALNTILLSAYLDPDRYETRLVGGRLEPGEKSMAHLAVEKGVHIEQIDEMGRSLRALDDLRALWRVIRLIRRFRPDIVHTHTAKAGGIGRIAAFLCGVPIRIHTFHGHTFRDYFSPWVSRLVVWTERLLAVLSHRIVTISPRQFQDITQLYKVAPVKKTRVIPLGFELEKICAGKPGQFRAALGLSADLTVAAILARLVPIKNHTLLIEAIALWLRAVGPQNAANVRFLIIGDGELRPSLEARTRALGLESFVVFTGWRSEVPEIYADIDLNVLVSKNEGTPVTLIEGLANGVPILTTDVGGIRDFADAACGVILAAEATPQQLADELVRLVPGHRRPDRLPVEIQKDIRAKFDVKRLVADMDHLYSELLHPGDRGS